MPSISLSPTQGAPGDTVTITGTGFAADSDLFATFGTLLFGGVPIVLTPSTTDGSGDFTATFTVPRVPAGIGESYTVVVFDGDGGNANATFDACGTDNADGIDVSQDPVLASGGEPTHFEDDPTLPEDLPVYAYIHHDGAHWVAWRDASVGGQFETSDPDFDPRLQLPPQANHTLNVTMVPDDGGAVVTYEVDTDYCWEFDDASVFICQCVYQPFVRADPIWRSHFWIKNWMKSVMDVKFASDGSNLWMAVLTRETIPYPYLSSDDNVSCDTDTKDCSSPSQIAQYESLDSIVAEMPTGNAEGIVRFYHPAVGIPDNWFYQVQTDTSDMGDNSSGQWSPPRIVMFSGGTGGFTRIGSMDAKYCPGITNGVTIAVGGALLGGVDPPITQVSPRGSFFSGISLAASEAEPGVCHMVWSEGGDWGTCGGIGSAGGLGGSHGEIFPPAGSVGANILSNGDFSGGLTNWEPNDTPPEQSELVGDQLRMYCGQSSVWFAGELKPPPSGNVLTPDHGAPGYLYRSTDWEPPEGKSIWQMTFTWQRLEFPNTDFWVLDQGVEPMPWGGVGWYPQYPGADPLDDSALFGSFESSGFGYYGPFLGVGPDITEDLTHYGVMVSAAISSTPDYTKPHSGGGAAIGTSYDYTLIFEIDNVGLSGVPWLFSFYSPLQLYDIWDYPGAPWWYSIGFAYGISNVTLAPYTPDDPIPADDPNPGDNTGTGSGFDRGPGNRDYRVGYSTWDTGGKTAEYDLFHSHIDRGGFYFPYDGGLGVWNYGYSWPQQEQLKATGIHAVRNDHGSPVLFIAWPNIVTNPDAEEDGGGLPWLDRGHVFTQPELFMYDIAGGTPNLLQTVGGDLLPTLEEIQHFWPAATSEMNVLHGGMYGYSEDALDDRTASHGSGNTVDRAIGVSRIYEDPLLGGQPVYLLHVPWASDIGGLLGTEAYMRCFYRVPCDGSAAFDFVDGIRQVEFTVMDDHGGIGGLGQGHSWTSQDFYSDPRNIWVPHGDNFGLQYDRVCKNQWLGYTTVDVPGAGNTFSIRAPEAWGSDYDPENDTISVIGFSTNWPVSLFDYIVMKICRECYPCKCVPVGMHVWQKV